MKLVLWQKNKLLIGEIVKTSQSVKLSTLSRAAILNVTVANQWRCGGTSALCTKLLFHLAWRQTRSPQLPNLTQR
jgi:hypothetical protein